MVELRPIGPGESLSGYSAFLAHTLFQGVVRDTGLPYTSEHLNKCALLGGELLHPSVFLHAATAALWLHDGPEDMKILDVHNPFGKRPNMKDGGKYFLNGLLLEAGDAGRYACYIVNLLTHRKELMSYSQYTDGIFRWPEDEKTVKAVLEGIRDAGRVAEARFEEREIKVILQVVTLLSKMIDRRMNLNPDESKNVNELVKEYLGLENGGIGERMNFYRRTKTVDSFERKGDYGLDVGLLVETIRRNFEGKQKGVAIDNITKYLPLAERMLLVEVSPDNRIFKHENVRKMLKGMWEDSLDIADISVYDAKRMGENRGARETPGYAPILREIRMDRVRDPNKGKLAALHR